MEYDELIEEIKELDKRLQDIYTEIDDTIFKGESRDGLVRVDLKGSFEVRRITISDTMNYTDEDLIEDLKEAFNNALMMVKKERNTAISQEIFNRIVESRVRDEIKNGVQTIQYQVSTIMTTNGQAPFITFFMYIDESQYS